MGKLGQVRDWGVPSAKASKRRKIQKRYITSRMPRRWDARRNKYRVRLREMPALAERPPRLTLGFGPVFIQAAAGLLNSIVELVHPKYSLPARSEPLETAAQTRLGTKSSNRPIAAISVRPPRSSAAFRLRYLR